MKLATLHDGSRDGVLVVVDAAMARCVKVPAIAGTLQAALDAWETARPKLEAVSRELAHDPAMSGSAPFSAGNAAAPLPRAYQWCDGSAYLHHAELVRKARGAEMPTNLYHDPLMYQGGSDVLLGAHADIVLGDESWGLDLEAEIAVVTDDVPMGTSAEEAGAHIVLVMLVNDISLRNLLRDELAKGFGFYQSKPATAFSPVALTPDELGPAWDGRKVSLPLTSLVNGQLLGQPNSGVDLYFDFPQLIAHAARTRSLGAGTIIGSGTVSNRDLSTGSACLAERRMLEQIATGQATTPFLKIGDRVTIYMNDGQGRSLFGSIDQEVVAFAKATR